MVIDFLDNASRYYPLHPLFEKAFTYLRELNINTVEPGRYNIDGEQLRMIAFDQQGVSAAESILEFECHDAHIDIQVCISGKETFGWKPRQTCLAPKGSYDPDTDTQLFNDVPDTYFSLTDNQFVILFPEDVHAPMIAEDLIRKLVVKVKI